MSDKRIFTESDQSFAEAVRGLSRANPFLPERIEWEQRALGADFRPEGSDWNRLTPSAQLPPNMVLISRRVGELVERVAARWPAGGRGVGAADQGLFSSLVLFGLYLRFSERFDTVIREALAGRAAADRRLTFYAEFEREAVRLLRHPGVGLLEESPVEHVFACLFQLRRAFHQIHRSLVGGSPALARLRAAIWESVFTRDLELYRRVFWSRMHDFTTLVTGPSGTGKELVARAIALSRYVPFDPRTGVFASDFGGSFFALSLSVLSPTLIESELFGHRKGAFTGALEDRPGWLEVCPPEGTVFLDEIGEVEPAVQVKLLRVLQARTFQRLGETKVRRFTGKIIAATNRDLPDEIRAGRFREDFYYRLCSDQLRTPSLREQLDGEPGDLEPLVAFILQQQMGDLAARQEARDVVAWIERNLGRDYAWPGNVRELEQCIRNFILRGEYRPAGPLAAREEDWNALLQPGRMTAAEVLQRYTRHVHARSGGNVEETARRLDVDRRTVQARLAP
jgi:DNA-binding NtrC family response regulator